METYAHLQVGNYLILSSPNTIDPYLLSLFQPDDLITYERQRKDRRKPVGKIYFDEDIEQAIEYTTTVKSIIDRLEVYGFTLNKLWEKFEYDKEEVIRHLDNTPENGAYRKQLETYTLDDFLSACKEIADNKIELDTSINKLPLETNPLSLFILENYIDWEEDYINQSERILLRGILETIPNTESVTYDVSDIINDKHNWDDIEEIEDIYEKILVNVYEDGYGLTEKIIIMGEGSSDISILENSISILYPHLRNYYSFMDFDASNVSGSANSLVTGIKSFVSAGIKSKVIALFDNDTAAEVALRGLNRTKLPWNIKILKYPEIELAQKYPTLGSAGISNMDVNGLAGSIELYLGKDVLTKDGSLIPIHWKGYDQTAGKYQGELIEKQEIQKKYKEKVRLCKENKDNIKEENWVEMDKLLKNIFNAFNT